MTRRRRPRCHQGPDPNSVHGCGYNDYNDRYRNDGDEEHGRKPRRRKMKMPSQSQSQSAAYAPQFNPPSPGRSQRLREPSRDAYGSGSISGFSGRPRDEHGDDGCDYGCDGGDGAAPGSFAVVEDPSNSASVDLVGEAPTATGDYDPAADLDLPSHWCSQRREDTAPAPSWRTKKSRRHRKRHRLPGPAGDVHVAGGVSIADEHGHEREHDNGEMARDDSGGGADGGGGGGGREQHRRDSSDAAAAFLENDQAGGLVENGGLGVDVDSQLSKRRHLDGHVVDGDGGSDAKSSSSCTNPSPPQPQPPRAFDSSAAYAAPTSQDQDDPAVSTAADDNNNNDGPLSDRPAWVAMCLSLERYVPARVPVLTTASSPSPSSSLDQPNNQLSFIRRCVQPEYSLLSEVLHASGSASASASGLHDHDDLAVPLLAVMVASVQCHGHCDWTCHLIDETSSSSVSCASAPTDSGGGRGGGGMMGWMEERFVRDHPSLARPGVALLLKDVAMAVFPGSAAASDGEGEHEGGRGGGGGGGGGEDGTAAATSAAGCEPRSGATTSVGGPPSSTSSSSSSSLERVLLVGEDTVACGWTPEEGILRVEDGGGEILRRRRLRQLQLQLQRRSSPVVVDLDDSGCGSDDRGRKDDAVIIATSDVASSSAAPAPTCANILPVEVRRVSPANNEQGVVVAASDLALATAAESAVAATSPLGEQPPVPPSTEKEGVAVAVTYVDPTSTSAPAPAPAPTPTAATRFPGKLPRVCPSNGRVDRGPVRIGAEIETKTVIEGRSESDAGPCPECGPGATDASSEVGPRDGEMIDEPPVGDPPHEQRGQPNGGKLHMQPRSPPEQQLQQQQSDRSTFDGEGGSDGSVISSAVSPPEEEGQGPRPSHEGDVGEKATTTATAMVVADSTDDSAASMSTTDALVAVRHLQPENPCGNASSVSLGGQEEDVVDMVEDRSGKRRINGNDYSGTVDGAGRNDQEGQGHSGSGGGSCEYDERIPGSQQPRPTSSSHRIAAELERGGDTTLVHDDADESTSQPTTTGEAAAQFASSAADKHGPAGPNASAVQTDATRADIPYTRARGRQSCMTSLPSPLQTSSLRSAEGGRSPPLDRAQRCEEDDTASSAKFKDSNPPLAKSLTGVTRKYPSSSLWTNLGDDENGMGDLSDEDEEEDIEMGDLGDGGSTCGVHSRVTPGWTGQPSSRGGGGRGGSGSEVNDETPTYPVSHASRGDGEGLLSSSTPSSEAMAARHSLSEVPCGISAAAAMNGKQLPPVEGQFDTTAATNTTAAPSIFTGASMFNEAEFDDLLDDEEEEED